MVAILPDMWRNLVVFALGCLAVLVLAVPAGAQDDVFVDPDSPTGAEYDIPLERARRDASTDQSEAVQSYRSRTAPLFGEGIERGSAVRLETGRAKLDRLGIARRAEQAARRQSRRGRSAGASAIGAGGDPAARGA